MNKKNVSPTKSEFYTNLMLITVLEALILLIFQLAIFNASSIITMYAPIWRYILPTVFYASAAFSVVFIIATVAKSQKKTSFLPLAKFFVYLTLVAAIMRYIPNKESVETVGKYVVNFERGQKIAGITSIIYIIASFVYYAVLSRISEKESSSTKTKKIVHKKK